MITEAIIIGIVAWVFVIILMEEGMIFSFWWGVINKLPEWLGNPMGKCEYCMAGQLALWYYLFTYFHSYNILHHIAFISLSIFTVKIINIIESKWN